jgi:hypothetical protein
MDPSADPTRPDADSAHETREDEQMLVRRSPRYGVFMALGAVVGAVAAWIYSSAMPPSTDANGTPVDTSPVLGLAIVVGFVVGAALGGLVAWIIDRSLTKRARAVTVERTEVREVLTAEPHAESQVADASSDDAVDAEFAPLEPPAADVPDVEGDRPREA